MYVEQLEVIEKSLNYTDWFSEEMSGDKSFKMRRIPASKPGQQVQLVGAVSAAEGSQPMGTPQRSHGAQPQPVLL